MMSARVTTCKEINIRTFYIKKYVLLMASRQNVTATELGRYEVPRCEEKRHKLTIADKQKSYSI